MNADEEASGVAARQGAKRFAAFHKSDRNFFLAFLLACWLGVAMGFVPALNARYHGQANFPAPPILMIHMVAFVGWLLLLTVQILLVRMLRQRQHMALGLVGFALVPVMVVTAFMAEQHTQRFHFDQGKPNLAFFILPIFYVVGFAILASLALARRKQPAAHKRLILLATTVIIGAAYGRWWGEPLYEWVGDGYWGMIVNSFTGTNVILLGAVLHDVATRRRLHPVYQLGVPAILAGELVTSWIYHAPGWLPIAQAMIGR